MVLLPFNVTSRDVYSKLNITYEEAYNLYISANKRAENKNNVIEIIKHQIKRNTVLNMPKSCCICLDNIEDDNLIILSCNHALHKSCFNEYLILHTNDKCPVCRVSLTKEDKTIKLKKEKKKKYWIRIQKLIETSKYPPIEAYRRYRFYKNIGIVFNTLDSIIEDIKAETEDSETEDSESDDNDDIHPLMRELGISRMRRPIIALSREAFNEILRNDAFSPGTRYIIT